MSFKLLRNLGLGSLILLLLAAIFLSQQQAAATLAALRAIVTQQVPTQAALLEGRTHLATAQLHFDRYDQRERLPPEQVLEPLDVLASLLADSEAKDGPVTSITRSLQVDFASYQEEEIIDPAGEGALTLEPLLLRQVAELRRAISVSRDIHTAAGSSQQARAKGYIDRVEAALVNYIHRDRYHLDPVLSLLESTLEDFRQSTRHGVSDQGQRLIDSVERLRSQLLSYQDEELDGSESDTFFRTREAVYLAWESAERRVSETVAAFTGNIKVLQDQQVETAEAARRLTLWLTGLTTVLAIAIATLLSRMLTRRLQTLTDGARRFAGGDLDHRLPAASNDEIGRVAHTFNQMAQQLQNRTVELEQTTGAAQAANEAKSEFLAKMSHEIRTPMNGVLGVSELLHKEITDERQRRFVAIIQRSGTVLLRVIDDILDFSRIESGKLELETEPFDLRQVLDDVRELFGVPAQDKGLTLETQLDPGTAPVRLGDGKRVAQILFNLTGNAIKFTEQGVVRITVATQEGRTDTLLLEITDSGIGIPPDVLPHLFQAFQQADNSTARKYGGSGLGLVISRELARLMGGDIEVESWPDAGTRFRVRLPLARAPAVTQVPLQPPQADEASPDAPTSASPRVLLAEDNLVNQEVARGMLDFLGYHTDLVDDGKQALNAFQHSAYDLVLMDCHMPGMDGLEATHRIRMHESQDGKRRRVPILALTADAMPEQRKKCLNAGMDDFLPKPYSLEQMRDLLTRWLQ